MLEVQASEGAQPPKTVGVIDDYVVAAVLQKAEHEQPALGVPGGRAEEGLAPNLNELHLDLLVELSGGFEGAEDLVAERVYCDDPGGFVNGVLVLLLDLLNVAVVEHMSSREAEYLRGDGDLEVADVSSVASCLQLQEGTDELLLAREGREVEEVVLGLPRLLLLGLHCHSEVELIDGLVQIDDASPAPITHLISPG